MEAKEGRHCTPELTGSCCPGKRPTWGVLPQPSSCWQNPGRGQVPSVSPTTKSPASEPALALQQWRCWTLLGRKKRECGPPGEAHTPHWCQHCQSLALQTLLGTGDSSAGSGLWPLPCPPEQTRVAKEDSWQGAGNLGRPPSDPLGGEQGGRTPSPPESPSLFDSKLHRVGRERQCTG